MLHLILQIFNDHNECVKSLKIVEPTSYRRERSLGEKERTLCGFFPVSHKNTKDKRIVLRIMAKNTRYERVSAVAVAMMGRGKWSTKDYEILENIFIPSNAGKSASINIKVLRKAELLRCRGFTKFSKLV
ncbi:hypothetical protein AVEN_198540-1 [Araneus ventricosus]|uniref:Uncharacterized protein n=1 Tax=Araneus ventricosus TaxID=182803 RepID=A0A4Y2HX06_ARAVE|nr:hypothetical protein AVEN_198540-1 [Araneus ventricosus]